MNLLGIEFKRVFGKFETFLDESSEFTDATALFSKDFLGVGSTDDNLRNHSEILSGWICNQD